MPITHSTVVVVPDDGTSPVGTDEWNAAHTVTTITATGGTVTASTPVLDGTQTWNASGVTFTGYKLNITNTASAAGSLLMDLQIGGNSIFYLDKTGLIEQKNGISPTAQRVYNTYTDASNYERGVFDWTTTANTLTIGTQKAGTGSNRDLALVATSANFNLVDGSSGSTITQAFRVVDVNTMTAGNAITLRNSGVDNNVLRIGTAAAITFSTDANISRAAANVLRFGDGSGTLNGNGWMQWAGQVRVTADVPYTSTTTLSIATGLTVALQAGRTYSFSVHLPFTCAAAGGVRAAMVASGGLTATNIIYDGWIVDSAANGIKGNVQATALGTVVGGVATIGTAGHVCIYGTITVNVAGSLQVHASQGVSSVTATNIKRGAFMTIQDMP